MKPIMGYFQRAYVPLFFLALCLSFYSVNAQSATVDILGSWTSGLTHTAEAGTNRFLIFTAHCEDKSTPMNLQSVTYGGVPMTKVLDMNAGNIYRTYVCIFVMNEGQIAAASSSNFSVTWQKTPSYTPAYSSVFVDDVDQADPLVSWGYNALVNSDRIIDTGAMTTGSNGRIFLAATRGVEGTYTCNNSFTEALELSPSSADGVVGHKATTGTNETPKVTHSITANSRHAIIAIALRQGGAGGEGEGEGEGEQEIYAATLGDSIQKTTNGGLTWNRMDSGITGSSWMISIGRASDGDLYTSSFAGDGIYKSTNSGSSWSKVNSGIKALEIRDVAVAPSDNTRIYGALQQGYHAGAETCAPTQAKGDINSTTGGVTWTNMTAMEVHALEIAVDPGNKNKFIMGTFQDGFYVSSDGGSNATQFGSNETCLAATFDSDNTNIIVAGTIDFDDFSFRIHRSTNGGSSFSSTTYAWFANEIIEEPGSQVMWAATVDGVYKSTNNGSSWTNKGLVYNECTTIAQDCSNTNLLYTATLNEYSTGTVYKTTNGGTNWTTVSGITFPTGAGVGAIKADPDFTQTFYVGLIGSERSIGTGDDFRYAVRGGVWVTLDASNTWYDLSTSALYNDQIYSMDIGDLGQDRYLYVSTYGGSIFRLKL